MQTEQAVTDYNSDEMAAKWIIQGSAAYVTPGGWAGRHDITHKTSMYIHQWLTVLYSISFIDDRQLQPRRTGQDRTGQDKTGQDRTRQDRTGQDRTGYRFSPRTLFHSFQENPLISISILKSSRLHGADLQCRRKGMGGRDENNGGEWFLYNTELRFENCNGQGELQEESRRCW